MIDTIRISWEGVVNISPTSLDEFHEVYNNITGEVIGFKGRLNNLNVNYIHFRLTIQGSLSRYITDYNLNIISYDQVLKAIGRLNEIFEINLGSGIITRLDLANNFEVDVRPKTLYKFFLNSNNYNRFEEKNTLYYNSGARKKTFYDKSEKSGKYLLRFETRYGYHALRNWANKNLSKKYILVEDIITREKYNRICGIWHNEFNAITLSRDILFDFDRINGVKDFEAQLALEGMKSFGGFQKTSDMLTNSFAINTSISTKMKTRLNNYLKTLRQNVLFTKENLIMKNIFWAAKRKMWENYAF